MRILLSYDGSPCSDAALDDLAWAGLPPDADIQVLTVADVLAQPEMAVTVPESLAFGASRLLQSRPVRETLDHAQQIAERGATRLNMLRSSWSVQAVVKGGPPAREIIEHAEREKIDLIVVGSHGRGAFLRTLLGSVSQRLVHHAPCSLRVVHRRKAPEETLRLLVAIDTSQAAEQMVSAVAWRSWPEPTEVRLVHALTPPVLLVSPLLGEMQQSLDEQLTSEGRVAVKKARDILETAGLCVSTEMAETDPKRLILEQADLFDAHCIFVGARGLSRVERFLVGSVSSAVAAAAQCSVEVVR